MPTEPLVVVSQADIDAAIEADQGAIDVARALADRDCGALLSEMRIARQEYLARFLAQHAALVRNAALEEAAGAVEALSDKLYYSHRYAEAIRALSPLPASEDVEGRAPDTIRDSAHTIAVARALSPDSGRDIGGNEHG